MSRLKPLSDDDFDKLSESPRVKAKQAFENSGVVGRNHHGATTDMARIMISAGMGTAEELFKGKNAHGRYVLSDDGIKQIKEWQKDQGLPHDGDVGFRTANAAAKELGHPLLIPEKRHSNEVKGGGYSSARDALEASKKADKVDGYRDAHDALAASKRELRGRTP